MARAQRMSLADIAVLILASGRSRRFGAANKLLAPFCGKPLGAHVLTATEEFSDRYVVVPSQERSLINLYTEAGVRIIPNADPETGQGASLALGISAVAESGARAALVVLADMPFVNSSDLEVLWKALDDGTVVASERDGRLMPPVLFEHAHFEALSGLTGEAGGRDYLRQLSGVRRVPLRRRAAIDIDTEEDLRNYHGPSS